MERLCDKRDKALILPQDVVSSATTIADVPRDFLLSELS
jgi:hypothetical protein